MAAAYAAKSITAETAIKIAYYRGLASSTCHRPGGMAAIGLGQQDITPFLEDGVIVACENSPTNVVISGDEDAVIRVMARIEEKQPDIFIGRLDVKTAYHSRELFISS